jgi:hypothetical protein
VADSDRDPYSAAEQALGYIYQARFALLKLLQLPESTSIFLEKDDDLDFVSSGGSKALGSLKHKAVGGHLSDLSVDFWKSVRIWLKRYDRDARSLSTLRFFLFTTETVADDSFLKRFVDGAQADDSPTLSQLAADALARSRSKLIASIAEEFEKLTDDEKEDFLSRVTVFDGAPRIGDVPTIVKELHMRSIRRDVRSGVFERLEGWWSDTVVNLLSGLRAEAVYGYEISDRLSAFADEYKSDNLPIDFRGKEPGGEIDTEKDSRLFVVQLREIGIASNRIRNAILDYYRAFEQRSVWARETLLVAGEIEEYEDRLVDEWTRFKDVVFEDLDELSAEETLIEAGKALYRWADLESGNIAALRIRARVTEPYVLRGGFHILANASPRPRVYWHPRFLSRVGDLLGVSA